MGIRQWGWRQWLVAVIISVFSFFVAYVVVRVSL